MTAFIRVTDLQAELQDNPFSDGGSQSMSLTLPPAIF
jgi:hypothetical protein